MNENRYLTVHNAAKKLGLSRASLYRIAHNGEIDYIRTGPRIMKIKYADMVTYLAKLNGVNRNEATEMLEVEKEH